MAKKIAIILSGCGVFDGSEIHEATLAMLHIKKNGADYICVAPNTEQLHVINHTNSEVTNQTRNVLTESARIARGAVTDIAQANPADFDGIIFPGGFGAAKNLSNFAIEENIEKLEVEHSTEKFIQQAFNAKVPIGFICVSPAAVAAVALRNKGLQLTIGSDNLTAKKIEELGHTHITTTASEIVVDKEHNIISTAAYMCGQNIAEIEQGIAKLVKELINY